MANYHQEQTNQAIENLYKFLSVINKFTFALSLSHSSQYLVVSFNLFITSRSLFTNSYIIETKRKVKR